MTNDNDNESRLVLPPHMQRQRKKPTKAQTLRKLASNQNVLAQQLGHAQHTVAQILDHLLVLEDMAHWIAALAKAPDGADLPQLRELVEQEREASKAARIYGDSLRAGTPEGEDPGASMAMEIMSAGQIQTGALASVVDAESEATPE